MSEIIRYNEWRGKLNPAAIGMSCNIEQYRTLKSCSEKKDITEWNEWRAANASKTIWLCGANLKGAWLEEAWLGRKLPVDPRNEKGTARVHLEGSALANACLDRTDLRYCQLSGAHLRDVKLRDADVRVADLRSADVRRSELQGSDFQDAHIQATNLLNAHLEGVVFIRAIVDSETVVETPHVDRETDFTTVGLDTARVAPRLKVTLKDNIREKQWRGWYREVRLPARLLAAIRELGTWLPRRRVRFRAVLAWIVKKVRGWTPPKKWKGSVSTRSWPFRNVVVRGFWAISDHGRSTRRIIGTFFALALLFGALYYAWGLVSPPGIVANLFQEGNEQVPRWLVPVRATYFSVVTMTTLGFGDIYADKQSLFGHVVLMLQVLLGYVLLGALVTRFAVMFSGSGPAAKLSPRKKK